MKCDTLVIDTLRLIVHAMQLLICYEFKTERGKNTEIINMTINARRLQKYVEFKWTKLLPQIYIITPDR